MNHRPWLWLIGFGLVWSVTGGVRAQEAANKAAYQGSTRCLDCHLAPNPVRPQDFISMSEAASWLKHDKHSQAFELLGGPRAQRMAKHLGIENAQTARQCLSCHAGPTPAAEPTAHRFGVSCEACHGPSSRWDRPHSEVSWRGRTPDEKQRLGMTDLRNPMVRAKLCQSCHIGNAEQGKVVTHAMYVAGHPPLPSFEVESFSEQMPAHWRRLPEKGDFQSREQYERANRIVAQTRLPRTKSLLIGAVSALQTTLQLHSSQFNDEENSATSDIAVKVAWPEYAAFDCASCHHELRNKSWRQRRGYLGPPGRPPLPSWPTALLPLAIGHAARAADEPDDDRVAEFHRLWRDVQQANGARPFGRAEQVRPASRRMMRWLDALASELQSQPCTIEDGKRVVRHALKSASEQIHDYESARQLAWALRVVAGELAAPYPARIDDDEAFQRWRSDVRTPAILRLKAVYKELTLTSSLALDLPATRDQSLEDTLPQRLETAWRYDSTWFQQQAGLLGKQLPAP